MPDKTACLPSKRRQFSELSRLFFDRFLENDLISLNGDSGASLASVLALLAMPGLFLPFFEFVQFSSVPLCYLPLWARDLASLPDKAIYVALSMTVAGIATVLEWDAILPDRRDCAILRPLPVGLATLFSAKLAALLKFWSILAFAVNGAAILFFPLAVIQKSTFAELVWFAACHSMAVIGGSLFMFLAMIAVQGLLLNLLGWRKYRGLAPYAQSVLVTLMLVMFFVSLGAAFRLRPGTAPPPILMALPPLWFVGMYQLALGWTKPVFEELAIAARTGLGVAALAAAAGYAMSYKRVILRSFEEPDAAASRPSLVSAALGSFTDRFLLHSPAERATFHFVRQTIMRSRGHRMILATSMGAGMALVFQGLAGLIASGSRTGWERPQAALLAVPLVLSLFLLCSLRYVFTVPAELRANWLFQMAALESPEGYLLGVRKAVAVLVLLPFLGFLAPPSIVLWGWSTGITHTLFCATVAYLLMDALLAGMEKIPFTCPLVPGKANLKASWPFCVLTYLAYVSVLTALEVLVLQEPWRFGLFLVVASAAKAGIEKYRETLQNDDFILLFDDAPEPAVRTLQLLQ